MTTARALACILCVALGAAGCATPPPVAHSVAPAQADAAYRRGDFANALRDYIAWPGGAQDPDIQAKIGNCAALLGHPEQARRAYLRALELDPDRPEVRYNLAVLDLKQAQAQLIAALPLTGGMPALQQHVQQLLAQLAAANAAPGQATVVASPDAPRP